MIRERIAALLRRLIAEPAVEVGESVAEPATAAVVQPQVALGFHELVIDKPSVTVDRDIYMYVQTPDGEVWELPLTAGTQLRIRGHRRAEDWPGFHGCSFE